MSCSYCGPQACQRQACYKTANNMSREFIFTDNDFKYIKKLVIEKTGISLSDGKRDMVYSRLSRRLRKLDLDRFDHYLNILKNDDSDELVQFINAITTNLTSFFRENHHFEFLANKLIPSILANKKEKRIRIWSAGCSTGEEPYSIAMVMDDFVKKNKSWDIKILATDLDTSVVEKASRGVYQRERINGITKQRASKYFTAMDKESDEVIVSRDLKDLITFKQLNLMHDWPMKGPFDMIFCRNVVIYFDKPTQRKLFDRYEELLPDNGHLFIGHSESLFKVTDKFVLLGNTIYKKKEKNSDNIKIAQGY